MQTTDLDRVRRLCVEWKLAWLTSRCYHKEGFDLLSLRMDEERSRPGYWLKVVITLSLIQCLRQLIDRKHILFIKYL